jgi:branched-chain amino acid transport system permease protein
VNAGIVVQLAIDSIAAAALYGLVALAVTLCFSGSGTLHLAIGQVAVAGGLVAAVALSAGLPLWLAVVAGLAVGGALSAAAERGLVAPASGRPLLGAVLLLAGGLVLREVLLGVFSKPAYGFPSAGGTFFVAGGVVHVADLLTIGVVLATAFGGAAALRSTTVGAALRLTASAPQAAERIGVDTARMRAVAFGAGGVLATAAILLGVARFPLAATGGVPLALRGIAAAAAGGMRSPARVVAASLAIGAVQVVGAFYLGGGGEAIADAVAVALIATGWRR